FGKEVVISVCFTIVVILKSKSLTRVAFIIKLQSMSESQSIYTDAGNRSSCRLWELQKEFTRMHSGPTCFTGFAMNSRK
ncbi:unnamed protein product, partial [Citrullus colocynthis]